VTLPRSLCPTCPQIINSFASVAIKAGLEGSELCAMVVVVLNSLDAYMTEQVAAFHASKKRLGHGQDALQLAAAVNDYDRLQVGLPSQ
jgi:hypothetical protein